MKKSKRTNPSKLKSEVDRISNLSDDILHLILSRLPTTEEVIRTSILSTRWRYLLTSFSYPSLDIDLSRTLKSPTRSEMNKFKEFMDRVLANKSLDLDNFRLCCVDYNNMRTVGRWIDAAVTRNVKLLYLMVNPGKEFKSPHCLVNNGSLEVLRLFLSGSILSLPNYTQLPSLRVLEFNNVKLEDEELVERFLKTCPMLEDLSLIDCWIQEYVSLCISSPKLKNLRIENRVLNQGLIGSVHISCPQLVFLEFAGFIYHDFYLGNLDSLKKVKIYPALYRLREGKSPAEISHPGGFSLGINFEYEFRFDTEPFPPYMAVEMDNPVPLPSLKTLELTTTIDFLTKDALINLLIGLPQLESLHLIILQAPFWPNLSSNLGEGKMLMLTEHLKTVEFVDFNGEKEKLFVARLLLEHGQVLEEMVFNWGNEAMYHEKSMETMKEVSKFYKDSSTVKLINLLKS